MNVIIVGQKWLAAELLNICIERGDHVISVIAPTAADRLTRAAQAGGIKTIVRDRLEAADIPQQTDVILCAHNHAYVTPEAIRRAKHGALGYHPSLLPKHRGRDAIRWAIHMREQITGGTLYWLNNKADGGLIAKQHWCWILPNDTPDTLWRRDLAPLGLKLFKEVLAELDTNTHNPTPQNDSIATFEPAFTQLTLSEH